MILGRWPKYMLRGDTLVIDGKEIFTAAEAMTILDEEDAELVAREGVDVQYW